jgi:cell division cycle 14
VALKETPSRTATRNGKPLHYFQIDTELIYWNFFRDFGPLNLGQLYRFSMKLNSFLEANDKKNHIIVFYSSSDPSKRANAIYLITAWQILYLNRTPEEAIMGFPKQQQTSDSSSLDVLHLKRNTNLGNSSSPPLAAATITTLAVPPFHDASPFACNYDLTILDCLRGLIKARNYGFFDFSTFDVEEYEHFEQVEVRTRFGRTRNWIYFLWASPQTLTTYMIVLSLSLYT